MELLTAIGTPRIHGSVTPRKITERVRLGEILPETGPIMGIKVSDVIESFFRDITPPRLESVEVIRKAIARGIEEGIFAYTNGPGPIFGNDGKFQVSRDKIVLERKLPCDEIDLETGFLMVPTAIPEVSAVTPLAPGTAGSYESKTPSLIDAKVEEGMLANGFQTNRKKRIVLVFEAGRDQVYKSFSAIANLTDKSDGSRVKICVEGSAAHGFDPSWLRNAVYEPLEEADIDLIEE